MTAHQIPYAATMSIAHPEDVSQKIKTALSMKGFRFLLMHSPCPTGWKSEPEDSIELVRSAVASGLFPVYEVYDGATYRVNVRPDGTDPADYFERQRRFKDEEVNLDVTRSVCAERMRRLDLLAEQFPHGRCPAIGPESP